MSTKNNQETPVKILISTVDRPERIYANHIQVRYSPLDMTLEFCEFDAPDESQLKRKGDHAELTVHAKVRIVLTHDTFGKLSAVMSGIAEKHDIKSESVEVIEENEHKP